MPALQQRAALGLEHALRGRPAIRCASSSAPRDHVAVYHLAHDAQRLGLLGLYEAAGQAKLLGDGRRQHGARGRVARRDALAAARDSRRKRRATAIRRSQSSARAKPPAIAGPFTAATIGRRQLPTASNASGAGLDELSAVLEGRRRIGSCPFPEQNALPAPVSTMHPTVPVLAIGGERVGELEPSSIESAFRFSGRRSVTSATSSWRSIDSSPATAGCYPRALPPA